MKTHPFKAFLVIFILSKTLGIAQQTVTIDLSDRYQTMQGFGASDAWNIEPVGQHWNLDVKEEIAALLFSKGITGNNPDGIGLSRWRFNIGGGSTEQGDDSNISQEERRSECFIESVETVNGQEVVTYNWNKQSGQQWFLNAANNYGVEQLVGFVNSPPRFYTKNGRTNSDNTNRFGTTNLASTNYNRFTDFLVTVLKHFDDDGITFSQISPINEPQYPWNSNQEGCPWKHDEVYKLVDKLNRDIIDNNLDTKILISESADYRYLTGIKDDSDKSDIIDNYFDPSSSYYMGDFTQVLPGIASHSYWINGSDESIASVRTATRNKADDYNLEVYQTEYNLLGTHHDDKLLNTLFLAKIIYADLEITGVSIWDYWTAIERERWSQKNRFYLLRLIPGGGNYASLENTGSVTVDKNLWALGNFSRFIRPGYQRISTTGADDLNGLMGVSFIAPDHSELITIYVNWSDNSIEINQSLANLPENLVSGDADVFVTDANHDLTKTTTHTLGNTYAVPNRAIVTFRTPLTPTNECNEPSANISHIEAECYDDMAGIQTEDCDEGTLNVGYINDGDWLKFEGVDLTNQQSVKLRVASGNVGGTIEVRIDETDGEVIAQLPLNNTGGWQTWKSDSAAIISTSGTHDIFLVFKGGEGYLMNLNHFGFSETSIITSTSNSHPIVTDVFPNPFHQSFNLTLPSPSPSSIRIFNSLGQPVLSKRFHSNQIVVDLNDEPSGIYFIRINQNDQESTHSIFKN